MAGNSIKAGKYNEKIRDVIRDFYTYGWKTAKDMDGSPAAVSNDVKRLREAIIDDNIQWYGGEALRNRTLSLSVDSNRPKSNPFHRAYWYCTHSASDIVFFLSTILLLSPNTTFDYEHTYLRRLFFEEDAKDVETDFDQIINWYVEEKEKQGSLSNKAIRLFGLRQSEKLEYDKDSSGRPFVVPGNDYNTVRRRMEEWLKIGIAEHADGGRKSKVEAEGEHWKLSGCLLRELLNVGRQVDDNFDAHLKALLSFYSRSFVFGEIGTGLLRRLDWESDSTIHVLDDFYMQSLSDFVLFDVLGAIEKNQWCLIRYKSARGIENHIVKPLQIRNGLNNGRQHLLAFNVNNLQIDSLLISAINSVDLIDSYDDIRAAYKSCEKELPTEIEIESLIQEKTGVLAKLWGVTIPEEKAGETSYENVKIVFNLDAGSSLLAQINREKRNGIIVAEGGKAVFSATVPDGRELIPWIRRYYGNIISVDGINPNKYSIKQDAVSIKQVMENGPASITILPGRKNAPKDRIDYITEVTPKSHCSEEHNSLFHECFSEEYLIAADWLMQIMFGKELENHKEVTEADMWATYVQVCSSHGFHVTDVGIDSGDRDVARLYDELLQLVDETRLLRITADSDKRMGKRRYNRLLFASSHFKSVIDSEKISFYRDFLPLTKAERRWLVSVLLDSRSKTFFDSQTISVLLKYIDANPYPMGAIVSYDKPISEIESVAEGKYLSLFLQAVSEEKAIEIKYIKQDEEREVAGIPLFVEYSKREDSFRTIVEREGKPGVEVVQLGWVRDVRVGAVKCNREVALKAYEDAEVKRSELDICFVDAKNLANRLFTELAPWERISSKDNEIVNMFDYLNEKEMSYNQFRMKLRYDVADKEILVRKMLSLGPYLQLTEDGLTSDGVSSEYQRRVIKQLELLKE
ncbi:MAG: WYL domain-containing protein [Paludibacteraceae bacterium]|nr:WYL domain-containing protein [Paludibacteraceae bacterium]